MYHGEIVCPETININEFNNLLSLMNVYLIADHKESKNTTDIILCGMFKISKNKKTEKISLYSATLNIDQETRVLTKEWRLLRKPSASFDIPLFWSEAKNRNNSRYILKNSIREILIQLVNNGVSLSLITYLIGEVDAATFIRTAKENNNLLADFTTLKNISKIKMLGIDASPVYYRYLTSLGDNDPEFSLFIRTMKITQEDFIKNYQGEIKSVENKITIAKEYMCGESEIIIAKKHRYLLSNKKNETNIVEKKILDVVCDIADQMMDRSYYFLTKDAFIASSKKISGVLWGMIDNQKFSEMCKTIFYAGSHFSKSHDLILKSSQDAVFSDYYNFVNRVVVADGINLGGAYSILGQFIKTKKEKIKIGSDSSRDIAKTFHSVYPFTTGDVKKIRKLSPLISLAYLKSLIASRNNDDKKFLLSLISEHFLKKYPVAVISRILHLARTNILGKNESNINKSHYRIFYKWLQHNSEKYKEIGFAKNMNFWRKSISDLENVIHHFQQNFIFVNNNMHYETMVLIANPLNEPEYFDNNGDDEPRHIISNISDEDLSSERLTILSYICKNNNEQSDTDYTSAKDTYIKINDESDIEFEECILRKIFKSRRNHAKKLNVDLEDIMNISWDAAIGDFKIGDYLIKEMNSFGKVYVESYEMLHCACSFAYSCYSNEYVMFSAVYDGASQGDDEKPRETIGINIQTSFNGEKTYSIDQVYGKRNESSAIVFRELAHSILKKLASLEKKRLKKLYTS